MSKSTRYSPEVRERAVRMVFEHHREYSSQWQAVVSIAVIGCTAETLRKWVRRAEVDSGRRAGVTSDERARIKELERENRELRGAMTWAKAGWWAAAPLYTIIVLRNRCIAAPALIMVSSVNYKTV